MLLKLSISHATCCKAPAAAKSHHGTANWEKKKMQWGPRTKELPSLETTAFITGSSLDAENGSLLQMGKARGTGGKGRSSEKERVFLQIAQKNKSKHRQGV